jgi:hypothetical protein
MDDDRNIKDAIIPWEQWHITYTLALLVKIGERIAYRRQILCFPG